MIQEFAENRVVVVLVLVVVVVVVVVVVLETPVSNDLTASLAAFGSTG